jgi:UDP-2-acetamido-2,6-beta-L-arabino-hexul-4-ose reductase
MGDGLFSKCRMEKRMKKIRVGITGQNGFIGKHLKNTLELLHDNFEVIPFERNYFETSTILQEFVRKCDVIVHLAGLNRHEDEQEIYNKNIDLARTLIEACTRTDSLPHIIFSSSTQEDSDNLYGQSKKIAHELFTDWAKSESTSYTGLIIPNVFGPFGQPFYNSVVATFCHQLTHNENPVIKKDGNLRLIYVSELVEEIVKHIFSKTDGKIYVPHTFEIKVSDLLFKLNSYKEDYLEKGIIPNITEVFNRNLFNTFLCYIDFDNFFPFHLTKHTDDRGSFVETVKLHTGGQVSFSSTVPGITRGNHFHTRKAERFAVISGKAKIEFRKVDCDKVYSFELDGDSPSFVDMPIWYTHNITNIGKETLLTIFWINEHYNPEDGDTYFVEV